MKNNELTLKMDFKSFKKRLNQLYSLNHFLMIDSECDLEDTTSIEHKFWQKSITAVTEMVKQFILELGVVNKHKDGENIIESFFTSKDEEIYPYYKNLEKLLSTKLRTPKQLFDAINNHRSEILEWYKINHKSFLKYLREN